MVVSCRLLAAALPLNINTIIRLPSGGLFYIAPVISGYCWAVKGSQQQMLYWALQNRKFNFCNLSRCRLTHFGIAVVLKRNRYYKGSTLFFAGAHGINIAFMQLYE